MNKFLKTGRWVLAFILVYGLSGVLSAQAPVRAEESQSPPPHLHANLWMQTSAEYQALCRQTFSSALREIKQAAKKAKHRQGRPVGPDKKPLAVVADLDETILDNARFQSAMDAAVWADEVFRAEELEEDSGALWDRVRDLIELWIIALPKA